MKTNFNDINDLLVKQLTGEATQAEHEQVHLWLLADKANRKYYDHFRMIWEESARLASATTVDENAAWERFQQKVQYEKTASARKRGMLFTISNPFMRAAAILVLVAGAAWLSYFLFSDKPVQQLAIESAGNVKKDTLPDGSQVTLNKHTILSYPNRFKGKERNVRLDGEAFFSVTPDKNKPFIIQTANDITIRVVGTSFNVWTRGDTTEVVVETGIVQVTKGDATVVLKAGEKIFFAVKEEILEKQPSRERLYGYYRNNRTFICDNTPLWKLVDRLNEAYDANIIFEDEGLRNVALTVEFDGQSLDEILNIISITVDMVIIRENGQILLDRPGRRRATKRTNTNAPDSSANTNFAKRDSTP